MKNFLLISPHYPQRIFFFAKALKEKGFRVLGIGDTNYYNLNDTLKSSLSDYIEMPLHCYSAPGEVDEAKYQALYKKVAGLISKHGRLSHIDSFNEFWLPLDAKLREDFNVEGPKPEDLSHLIRKSRMKVIFKKAGAEVARGEVMKDLDHLLKFLSEEKDIVVKPDIGVGASDTRRIKTREAAEEFYKKRTLTTTYFMEKFVGGKDRELVSFDGFTDKDGESVFHCMHTYSEGIMEVVGGEPLSYYNYMDKEIDAKYPGFRELGLKTVKEFGIRNRWHHIEFFVMDGKYWGLEINARPPGVLTLDCMNHAKSVNVWDGYAGVLTGSKDKLKFGRDWTAAYCARLNKIAYAHDHNEIMTKYKENIAHSMPMDSAVMGDFAYVVFAPTHEKRLEVMKFINDRK